jgi:hypothetical protein
MEMTRGWEMSRGQTNERGSGASDAPEPQICFFLFVVYFYYFYYYNLNILKFLKYTYSTYCKIVFS